MQPLSDEAVKNDVVEEDSKTWRDVYAKFSFRLKKKEGRMKNRAIPFL